MKKDIQKVEFDSEWLDIFEETIPHLENILKNPNRFIVNEEEVVKIELARRTTVDSIKHLAKHTNFIQSIDDKTGDVTPSKILNINKEEDYNTYENRVIYTLIQNMKFYVYKKKEAYEKTKDLENKNNKKLEYYGKTKVGNENITISLNLETKEEQDGKEDEYLKRIEKIDEDILILTTQDVYKVIEKAKVALVTPPIKKTNRILKNTDFQYAMKLWSYIQDNPISNDIKTNIDNENINNDKTLKRLIDETFLIDYLSILDDENNQNKSKDNKKAQKDNMIDGLLERIIYINQDLSKEQIKDLVADKYEVVKYKNKLSIEEIEKIFKENLDNAMKQISFK